MSQPVDRESASSVDYSNAGGSFSFATESASLERNIRQRGGQELAGKMLPSNMEAERSVLSGIMRYESLRDDIFNKLKTDDFYSSGHQLLYRTCYALYRSNQPIDPSNIASHLANSKDRELFDDIGGIAYCAELYSMAVLGASAAFYAEFVHSKSIQRRLINACSSIMEKTYDAQVEQMRDVLSYADRQIFAVTDEAVGDNDLRPIREIKEKFLCDLHTIANIGTTLTGITTGYPELDGMTGGLQNSDLIIIAARPSMGKTAFALNIAVNASYTGAKVAFFSLEMSASQLEGRILSIISDVPLSYIRQPHRLRDQHWKALYDADIPHDVCSLWIDDTPSISPLEMRTKARRLRKNSGLDLIVVDYLQLMRSSEKRNSRELEISDISRSLKGLAKEFDIPVIALSQLNRKLEERSGSEKRPKLSDLRESGAIEQDADVIMFLYREDVYNKKDKKTEEGEKGGKSEPEKPIRSNEPSDTEIIIGKQRNGPVGSIHIPYYSQCTRFGNFNFSEGPSESGSG